MSTRPRKIAKAYRLESNPSLSDQQRDGGVISTMAQAARLMTQRLPKARQEKPVWQHAAELLMQAHKSRKAIDMRAATDQLCRALQYEGWM